MLRLVAMFLFKSSSFSIPQKHIPTSSFQSYYHYKHKKGGRISIVPVLYPTQKIPPRMAATPSKLSAVDPGTTCPTIAARTPLLHFRVGDAKISEFCGFFWGGGKL